MVTLPPSRALLIGASLIKSFPNYGKGFASPANLFAASAFKILLILPPLIGSFAAVRGAPYFLVFGLLLYLYGQSYVLAIEHSVLEAREGGRQSSPASAVYARLPLKQTIILLGLFGAGLSLEVSRAGLAWFVGVWCAVVAGGAIIGAWVRWLGRPRRGVLSGAAALLVVGMSAAASVGSEERVWPANVALLTVVVFATLVVEVASAPSEER